MIRVKLFLDCDGVLADFDYRYIQLTGMHPRLYEETHGTKAFWKVISSDEDFFAKLPLMKDAQRLVDAVRHLDPTILTGVPVGDWSQPQKLAFRDKYFPGIPMICCPSKDKYKHMDPDAVNIIVDDWNKYKHIWEEAGGTFVLHTSVDESLEELRNLGVI